MTTISRRLLTIALLFLLSGCPAPIVDLPPPYLVMLAQTMPSQSRCAGVLLDSWHVLTADHCVDRGFLRVETQYGQTMQATPLHRWDEIDVAILTLPFALYAPRYARLVVPDTALAGRIYGLCPQHFVHTPRAARYMGQWHESSKWAGQMWGVWTTACGGDSGGVLVQNGNVAGVVVAVQDWYLFSSSVEGDLVCIVSAELVIERLTGYSPAKGGI